MSVPLLDTEIINNRSSRSSWDLYRGHRCKLTKLVEQYASQIHYDEGRPTLAFLGAGNGNDLDFSSLTEVLGQIDLIDWDKEAVTKAIARKHSRSGQFTPILNPIVPVDLSGIGDLLTEIANQLPKTEEGSFGKLANRLAKTDGVTPPELQGQSYSIQQAT